MPISMSPEQCAAILRARHVCLLDTANQLLRAALDGNQAARAALIQAWPGDVGTKSHSVRLDASVIAELAALAPKTSRRGPRPATAGITALVEEWKNE